MPFSADFKQDIKNLSAIDPMQYSGAYKHQRLIFEKISCFKNFLNWFIHIITFTSVPVNGELDKVAERILGNAQNIQDNEITLKQKELLTKAIDNLQIMIKRHGGAPGAENYIQETKNKIQNLVVVQNLGKKEKDQAKKEEPEPVVPKKEEKKDLCQPEPKKENSLPEDNKEQNIPKPTPKQEDPLPVIPPPAVSQDKKLQNLLRGLKGSVTEIAKEIGNLLPELEGSVDLYNQEIMTLNAGLANLTEEWINENGKKLNPNIVRFIVEKSFQTYSFEFLPRMFKALTTEPVNKSNLEAFVHGFPNEQLRPEGNYYQRVYNLSDLGAKHGHFQSTARHFLGNLTPEAIQNLKNTLSKEDTEYFIHSLFSRIATTQKFFFDDFFFQNSLFIKALNLVDDFGPEHRIILLKAMSKAVQVEALILILLKSNPDENLIQTILQNNPDEGAEDKFFEEITFYLLASDKYKERALPLLPSILSYVFEYETAQRQAKMLSRIPNDQKLLHIDHIPAAAFESLREFELIELAEEAMKIQDDEARRNQAQQVIASALEKKEQFFINSNKIDVYTTLLPFCGETFQINLIDKAIRDRGRFEFKEFFNEAEKLPDQVWEEIGKKSDGNLTTLFTVIPQAKRAAFVKGQVDNKEFLYNYFEKFKHLDTDSQKNVIKYLNPQLFKSNNLSRITQETWTAFYKVLTEDLNEENKSLLFDSTTALFNGPNFKYHMKLLENFNQDVLKLLPVEEYERIPRLILMSLTQRLHDRKRLATHTIEELKADDENSFFDIIQTYCEQQNIDIADILIYLINTTYELSPDAHFLTACIAKLWDYRLTEGSKIKIMRGIPPKILKSHVIPNAERLLKSLLFVLIKRVEGPDARLLIEAHWEKLTEKAYEYHLYGSNALPISLFLKLTDDSDKLKHLLQGILNANILLQTQNLSAAGAKLNRTITQIFEHLEKHPWKMMLLVDHSRYNKNNLTLKEWVDNQKTNGQLRYPNCKHIIDRYDASNFTSETCRNLNGQIQKFFNLTKEKKYDEAAENFKSLHEIIKNQLIHFGKNTTTEELANEVGYMNDGELFVAAWQAGQTFDDAIVYGHQQDLLTEERKRHLQEISNAAKEYFK